jgi:hypothetical protein
VRERERERNAPSAARRHSASATLCHAVAMVGTAPGTQVVRHIDASGLCTTHRCIRLVHDTSMHHACVRHIDASCLFTTHRCIMLVYDTSMHHACLRHIDASCLCTTHRCIRLVYDTSMHHACVRHIDASGVCTTHRCIRLVYDKSMHQACHTRVDGFSDERGLGTSVFHCPRPFHADCFDAKGANRDVWDSGEGGLRGWRDGVNRHRCRPRAGSSCP